MPPPVDGLPTGRPAGHQRHRVGQIDFARLDGLGAQADQELRETEVASDQLHGSAAEARRAVCEVPGGAEGEVPVRPHGRRGMTNEPMDVRGATATWSRAGQLDWWVKERQEWWGRVRGADGRRR